MGGDEWPTPSPMTVTDLANGCMHHTPAPTSHLQYLPRSSPPASGPEGRETAKKAARPKKGARRVSGTDADYSAANR